jgi:hypothetical protein
MSDYLPDLASAFAAIVSKMDQQIRAAGHAGPPVEMYVAGGIAMHYYSMTRYTGDVDASFSHRLMFNPKELIATYLNQDGKPAVLYFDANYNPTFALMHPDYPQEAEEWHALNKPESLVRVKVLSPVDLAVSKVARFSDQDQEDIKKLGALGLVTSRQLKSRAEAAMDYFIGNQAPVRANIEAICREIDRLAPRKIDPPKNGNEKNLPGD